METGRPQGAYWPVSLAKMVNFLLSERLSQRNSKGREKEKKTPNTL